MRIASDEYTQHTKMVLTRNWREYRWREWMVGAGRGSFDGAVSFLMMKYLRHNCKVAGGGNDYVDMDTGGWARIQDVVNMVSLSRDLEAFRQDMTGTTWHTAVYEMVMISLGSKGKGKDGKGAKARFQLAIETDEGNKEMNPLDEESKWAPSLIRVIQGHSIKFINVERTGVLLNAETIKGISTMCHGTKLSVIPSIIKSGQLMASPMDITTGVGSANVEGMFPGSARDGVKGRNCIHFSPFSRRDRRCKSGMRKDGGIDAFHPKQAQKQILGYQG